MSVRASVPAGGSVKVAATGGVSAGPFSVPSGSVSEKSPPSSASAGDVGGAFASTATFRASLTASAYESAACAAAAALVRTGTLSTRGVLSSRVSAERPVLPAGLRCPPDATAARQRTGGDCAGVRAAPPPPDVNGETAALWPAVLGTILNSLGRLVPTVAEPSTATAGLRSVLTDTADVAGAAAGLRSVQTDSSEDPGAAVGLRSVQTDTSEDPGAAAGLRSVLTATAEVAGAAAVLRSVQTDTADVAGAAAGLRSVLTDTAEVVGGPMCSGSTGSNGTSTVEPAGLAGLEHTEAHA